MRLEFPRRKLTRTELCGWKNSLVAGADPENYSRGGGGVFKHNYFQGSGGLEPSPRPSRIAQEIFVNGWEMKLSPVHFKFYIWNDSELSNTKFCGTSRDKYLYLLK